jgi:adenine deaminase
MLRSESSADFNVARDKRIQRMRQILCDGSWVREQRDAAAFERRTQSRLRDQSIDTEIHGCTVG